MGCIGWHVTGHEMNIKLYEMTAGECRTVDLLLGDTRSNCEY